MSRPVETQRSDEIDFASNQIVKDLRDPTGDPKKPSQPPASKAVSSANCLIRTVARRQPLLKNSGNS